MGPGEGAEGAAARTDGSGQNYDGTGGRGDLDPDGATKKTTAETGPRGKAENGAPASALVPRTSFVHAPSPEV